MTDDGWRQRLAMRLDAATAAALCAAVAIHLTGGVLLPVGDVRVSARRDERAVLLAGAFPAFRILLNRQQGPFGVPRAACRTRALTARSSDFRAALSSTESIALAHFARSLVRRGKGTTSTCTS